MKKGRLLNRYRKFSVSFKKQLVREFETNQFTVLELCRLHSIHNSQIYRWIAKYGSHPPNAHVIVEMKNSSSKKLKAYEDRIKELERIVGQKQIMIDYLDGIIECANEHYQTDLKKTSATPSSKPSGKKPKR